MESLDLFVRDPVTLDGIIPPFTRDETLLQYSYRKYRPGRGLGCWDEYDTPAKEIEESAITVAGKRCVGKMDYYRGSPIDIVAQLVNEILMSPEPKFVDNTAWKWLKENEIPLKKSFQYWKAMERVNGIKEAEERLKALQYQIRIGKILASVDAVQIHEGRNYNVEERQRACREFGMTESEIKRAYDI